MSDVRLIRMKNVRVLAEKVGGITALAKKIGRSQPYVSSRIGKTQSAYIGHETARDIERIFGLPSFYLDTLHGDQAEENNTANSNIQRLPLIKTDDLIEYLNSPLEFDTTKIKMKLRCPAEHSALAFVVQMVGDSMMANDKQSIADGSFVFIEPNLEPKVGQIALTLIDGFAEIRQISSQFGKLIAKPLNQAYPVYPLDGKDQIIGTCIASATIFGD